MVALFIKFLTVLKFALDEARRRHNDVRAAVWCIDETTDVALSHSFSFRLTQFSIPCNLMY